MFTTHYFASPHTTALFDLLASLTSFGILFCLVLLSKTRSRLPLPPGPKKLPLIGNALDMRMKNEWVTYKRWAQEYKSDVIHLNIIGTDIVILNSVEAANDLLEKRSPIYSSRARFPMFNELMGWDFNFAFQPYGEYWRLHRRLFHQEFHPVAALRFHPQEVKATHDLLRRLLDSPDDWTKHLRHFSGTIILAIAYGIDVQPSDDPYIEVAEKAIDGIMHAATPGTFLVDIFPFLAYVPEWVPGAGFKTRAKEWRQYARYMAENPFQTTKKNIENGAAKPSFTYYALDKMDPSQDIPYQEHIIMETAATMFAGGADTTVSALGTFILGVVTNPEVLVKAQRELDEVLGRSRLPEFSDEPSLPYITAIVMEVLRWHPVLPMAVPHLLTAEDTYKGYRIPAGSIVMANSWAILHDEATYPDPFRFNPDRFLKDGKIDPDAKDPISAFGYGRRICPGRYMAQASVWIAAASMLASFDITKAVDSDGSVIEPSGEYTTTMINYPLPFKCTFKPRSAEAAQLVASTEFQSL